MRDQDLHLGKTDQEKNTDNTPITYEEIARALAEDYVSLFVIDSEDDSYVEYLKNISDWDYIAERAKMLSVIFDDMKEQ